MNDDFEKRRSHMHAVTEFAAKTGPAWVEEFKSELSKLPTGTVVAINCVTGEYVTGTGLSEASRHSKDDLARRSAGFTRSAAGSS